MSSEQTKRSGISKPRMLSILSAAIKEAETRGLATSYVKALRDAEAILLGDVPEYGEHFWGPIIAESDKRSGGGFAAMSPERLREVSSHGRGGFMRKQNASAAGKKGALGRMRSSTPEQRSEWATLGAKAMNAKRNGAKHE